MLKVTLPIAARPQPGSVPIEVKRP
jgi:hypothetical protein